jgi:GNAT superfamily N-acetyltransferase
MGQRETARPDLRRDDLAQTPRIAVTIDPGQIAARLAAFRSVAMTLQIYTLRERPDLRAQVFASELDSVWPEFMQHDAASRLYFAPKVFDRYLDYAFAGVMDGKVVARAFSIPFAFGVDGRVELPDTGWDGVIRWAHDDHVNNRAPTTVSALEIALLPEMRGKSNSLRMLDAMKANAKTKGFSELYAPVRPNQKHLQPHLPMHDYAWALNDNGLPVDAWLRAHVRVGGTIVKIAPCSMTVVGSIAEWSRWTGLTFDRSGEFIVAGALVPVLVSLKQDHAVYVEPNVWVRHPL